MFKQLNGLNSRMVEQSKLGKAPKNIAMQVLVFFALFLVVSMIVGVVFGAVFTPVMLASPEFKEILRLVQEAALSGADFAEVMALSMANTRELMDNLMRSDFFMLGNLFSTAIGIAATIFCCVKIQKRPVGSLGFLDKKRAPLHYLAGAGTGLVMLALVYGFAMLFGGGFSLSYNGFSPVLLLYIPAYMLQSAEEEIMLRGFFMNALASRSSLLVAILLNSLVFSAMHFANPGAGLMPFVNIVIFGVIFSMLALLTDNIWAASGMHFAWNFLMGTVIGGQVSGLDGSSSLLRLRFEEDNLLTGGSFGVEASVYTTIFGLLICTVLFYLLLKKAGRAAEGLA